MQSVVNYFVPGSNRSGPSRPSRTHQVRQDRPTRSTTLSGEELNRRQKQADVKAAWLFDRQRANKWSMECTPPDEGVVVKVHRDEYVCLPECLMDARSPLLTGAIGLNVQVCSCIIGCS